MAPNPKRPSARQDDRASRRRAIVPEEIQQLPARDAPPLPIEVLPVVEEGWRRFWSSDVAKAIDPAVDLPGLYRWIVAYDEWWRAAAAVRTKRVVRGSMGQPVINPVAAYMAQREAELARAELAYGMSPRTRAALGLIFGEAKLTAAKLNEMTRAERAQPTEAEDVVDGEWEPA